MTHTTSRRPCFDDAFRPLGIRSEVIPFKPRPHELKVGKAEVGGLVDTLGINWDEDIHHRHPILSLGVFEAVLKVCSAPRPLLITISEKLERVVGKWIHPHPVSPGDK